MNHLEMFWTWLYRDIFNEHDFNLSVLGVAVLMGLVFYGLSGYFMLVDLIGRPKWMLRYKVQPGTNQPVDSERLWNAFKVSAFNHAFISVPVMVMLYPLQRYMGGSCTPEGLPSIWTFVKHVLGIMAVEEIGFYYAHRLAHWGPLYRHIHKQHHEWTAPVAIVAVYAHPLEHLACNVLPLTLGPALVGAHAFTSLIWYVAALSTTMIHHSGYHLPLMPSPEFHDYHHLKFNYNYGVLGVLDWFHGTDKLFRESPQFKRHQVLMGLRPMTRLFPDKTEGSKEE